MNLYLATYRDDDIKEYYLAESIHAAKDAFMYNYPDLYYGKTIIDTPEMISVETGHLSMRVYLIKPDSTGRVVM